MLMVACKKDKQAEDKKDSITATKSTLTGSNTTSTSPIQSLADVYKSETKQAQTYAFDAKKKYTVTCKEGTKITFNANSLVTEKSSKPVTGKVTLKVTEYYKKSDMVMANLTTTSNGRLLESAGMIYMEAYANGEKLKLKDGETAKIIFPTKKKNKHMQLFTGAWKKDYINWTVSTVKPTPIDTIIPSASNTMVYEQGQIQLQPAFPSGTNALYQYLNSNIKYPAKAREDGVEGKVIVSFIISSTGHVFGICILRGLTYETNTEVVRLISNMPKWVPGKQNGIPVNVRVTLPVAFSLDDKVDSKATTKSIKYTNDFNRDATIKLKHIDDVYEKEYAQTNKTRKKALEEGIKNNTTDAMSKIDSYVFYTSTLGWINCDQFLRDSRQLITYTIQTKQPAQYNIKLIFKRLNAIRKADSSGTQHFVSNLPIGEPITVVALKNKNGKNYYAIKDTVVSTKGLRVLNFNPLTLKNFEQVLEQLNGSR